jgi:hypothetical protein
LLPDPDCTPGVVSDTATAAVLCAKDYQPPRPPDAAITAAKTQVADAYARTGVKADPTRVAFLVPIRLGGTWNLQNMWPRGALVAGTTVDKVLKKLCATGSTLTLDEVHAAAVRNDLIALVNT